MRELTDPEKARLARRRAKMGSIQAEIMDCMNESIRTGQPFVHTARHRSLLLHFEAERVRVEDIYNTARDEERMVHEAAQAAHGVMRHPILMGTVDAVEFARRVLQYVGYVK
jgi:hypothetical protein